jgi:hypothetical protein
MYSVLAGQHFLNSSALCRIKEFEGGRMICRLLFRHDRLDGILAALHMADSLPLCGNRFTSGKLPSCLVLLAFHGLKLAGNVSLIEVLAHLTVSEVSHPAPQGVAHDLAFVRDGLTLEASILCKRDSFLRPYTRIGHLILLQCFGACLGLCDNAVGLITELIGNLPVRGEHLGRGENILFVACVVGSNLSRLWPAEAALCNGFLDLSAAWAGSLKILRRISLDVGGATLACLDLVAEIAEPEGQLRLVDRGCELLGIEEAALL